MTPGQDRLPQDINRVHQAVKLNHSRPVLDLAYMLDGENCDFDGFCGAYIWVEGFKGSVKLVNLIYAANQIWVNMGGRFSLQREVTPSFMTLNEKPDEWHRCKLYLADDYDKYNDHGKKFADHGIDRLIINLGLWNINDGNEQPFAIYFDEISIGQGNGESMAGDYKIEAKPVESRWWRGKTTPNMHIAGEHRYHLATEPEYTQLKDNKLP